MLEHSKIFGRGNCWLCMQAESTIVDELEEGKLVEEELQNRGFQTKLDPVQRVHGFYMSFTVRFLFYSNNQACKPQYHLYNIAFFLV